MKIKLFKAILLNLILLVSCSNKQDVNILKNNNNLLQDSIRKLNDSLQNFKHKPGDTLKTTVNLKSFGEFAGEFRDISLKSETNFINFCERVLVTFDYARGKDINQNPEESYEYILHYLKEGKMKAGKNTITFIIPEMPDFDLECILYFKQDANNNWKLYKYKIPA